MEGYLHNEIEQGHNNNISVSFTVGGLYEGEVYRFDVRAVNDFGTADASTSANASRIKVTPCGTHLKYDLKAAAGDRQVALSWTVTPDPTETIVKFQYLQNGGSWADIPNSGEDGTNRRAYPVTGLTNCLTYDFRVRAIYDIGSANSSDDASAKPLIERTPTFDIGSVTLIVPENTAPSTNIGSPITVTGGSCDTLTYSLDQTSQAAFDIDQGAGQLRTKAALDYESKNRYTVTVTATSQSQVSATIQVTITVTDVNEPPAFPSAGDRRPHYRRKHSRGPAHRSPGRRHRPGAGYVNLHVGRNGFEFLHYRKRYGSNQGGRRNDAGLRDRGHLHRSPCRSKTARMPKVTQTRQRTLQSR